MSEITTIPVPAPINLAGLELTIGDPGSVFISKITGTQTEVKRFGDDLTVTVEKMQLVANEVLALRNQAQAIVGFDGSYSGLTGLPNLSVYLSHTGDTVTDYREATSTNATSAVLDFAAGNVARRTLTAAIAFTLANIPAVGSAKLELMLASGGHAVDWSGIANLVWEASGQAPTLNTTDRIVFSKYDGDANIYAAHSKVA